MTGDWRVPHRRFDPLRREWVLVSPHRTDRPWQGQVERVAMEEVPRYDPNCYLCPGNRRANGATNPQYASTFAFDNDFAALLPNESPAFSPQQSAAARHDERASARQAELLRSESERGICRVVCFSPRHDLTLPRLELTDVRTVIETWIGECAQLAAVPWLSYALVFENRGATMGASNPHPHCQIWSTEHVPNEPAREQASLAAYREQHGTCLLCDYVALELAQRDRIVCENDHFVAVVPYWAVWPFETLLVARRHVAAMRDLDDAARNGLAAILKQLTIRYDNLFETSFPYSMGFHQPLRDDASGLSHLHAHYYPPLLRSATVRKFLVGFEMLGEPQRDLTAEDAAARLQAVDDVHHSERSGASR
jgi:UDPglucose--hexose-1-phosphate uridylyltransferase